MNNYNAKDFMKSVFKPFDKNLKKKNNYINYIYMVRILIITKVFLIVSVFVFS